MRLVLFCLNLLVFLLLQVEADSLRYEKNDLETDVCLDELEDCATLATPDFCDASNHTNLPNAIKCKLSCNLCRLESIMRVQQVANYNKKPGSTKHAKPTNVHAKPKGTSNIKAKSRPASRQKHSDSKTRTHAKRLPARAPKKVSHSRPKTQVRQSKSKPRGSKPRASGSRTSSKPFKPIGPNQIRIHTDVLLASQMKHSKEKASKTVDRFDQLDKHADTVLQDLEETLKQIDKDARTPVARIQLLTTLGLFQPRMRMYQAYWVKSAEKAKDNMAQNYSTTADYVSQDLKDLWASTETQLQMADGEGGVSRVVISSGKYLRPEIAYDVNQQQNATHRYNMTETLKGFSYDYSKILKQLSPLSSKCKQAYSILDNAIKDAKNSLDAKQAKQQVQKARFLFQKIKTEQTKTAGTFKDIASDYGKFADDFDKNRADSSTVRKPATGDPAKDDTNQGGSGKPPPEKS